MAITDASALKLASSQNRSDADRCLFFLSSWCLDKRGLSLVVAPGDLVKTLGSIILKLNGFGSSHSHSKRRFSIKLSWRKALKLLEANSHVKTAPDTVPSNQSRHRVRKAAWMKAPMHPWAKKQGMQWSPRGAHCVATIRAAVLDGRFRTEANLPLAA
jgi:hypothetical protein